MKNISRRQAIKQGIILTSAALTVRCLPAAISLVKPEGRADWMAGYWGIMVHWIAPGPGVEKGKRITDVDEAAEHFNVQGFMSEFEQTGASHLIFTVGQNTTYYASPNAVLDKYLGPGHCPKRDLVLDLARALRRRNKRFIAYLPAEIRNDPAMYDAFQWKPRHQEEFERRYTEFIRAYSLQWGRQVDGWWFDGCYTYDDYYVPRNWQLWCDAARAGNPRAAIAFNDGSFYSGFTQPLTPLQDYISGECAGIRNGRIALGDTTDPARSLSPSRYAPGTACQFHVLMPIDNNGDWINEKDGPMPPPKYTDAELFPFVRDCIRAGAAVTLNVGVYQEGRMSTATLQQLSRMRKYLG